jgi:hypothetical protein
MSMATMKRLLDRTEILGLRGRDVRIFAARPQGVPGKKPPGPGDNRPYKPRKRKFEGRNFAGPPMRRPHRGKKR